MAAKDIIRKFLSGNGTYERKEVKSMKERNRIKIPSYEVKSMNERYHIRDHEAGNVITKASSYYEAIDIVYNYIEYDKAVDDYKENFYEIYDIVNEEVVYIA